MLVLFINAADTSRHVSSANTAIYPNLGLLTLMSALENNQVCAAILKLGYLDGTVYGNARIEEYVRENAANIGLICLSSLTANHGASVRIAELAKSINPQILAIFGNDHFSAVYSSVMANRPCVDYGFYGSDVVEGFVALVEGLFTGRLCLSAISGLVYRATDGTVMRNPENSREYTRLPFVNYSLVDTIWLHGDAYLEGQQRTYYFMRGRGLRSQVVDIGRGCIKFAGPRAFDVPENACDFCGIIPGGKAVVSPSAKRAWEILRNCYDQGFNYFYVTADELPLTMWPLLRDMARTRPEWFLDIPPDERPKMFGYARAEGFDTHPEKIDVMVDVLGFDHFFVGFDGLSELSLRVMNKQPTGRKTYDLVRQNGAALRKIADKGCLVTAGFVVTHLGITRQILRDNLDKISDIVERFPTMFAALDFGPLCPIPGSQSFHYLTHPEYALEKAQRFGLEIDYEYLCSNRHKYIDQDLFEMDELIEDFVKGCCPDIGMAMVDEHVRKIADLAERHGIVVGGGV